MKISFYQQNITKTEKEKNTEYVGEHISARNHIRDRRAGKSVSVQANMGVVMGSGFEIGSGSRMEKGKSLLEVKEEARNTNVGISQDYMTLMSHTMSEEDYAKLQEEGFCFENLEPEEAITIVDKIKAEILRSGKRVAGYTDDLDTEVLAEALGSTALAAALKESFTNADLSLTSDNVQSVMTAWNMAKELLPPEEGAIYYLIDNDLDCEVWNLYLAENSGADAMTNRGTSYVREDVEGYFVKQGNAAEWEGLSEQIEEVIISSGRPLDENSRNDAMWLLKRGLPLTEDNLKRLAQLNSLMIPVSEQIFADAATEALSNGKSVMHAGLMPEHETLYQKAVRLDEYYHSDQAAEHLVGDITARRQLEEIRLRMTAEVNIKLLKSGYAIDTEPMEKLVEELRRAETDLAARYFPDDTQAVERYRTYRRTETVVRELPSMPARILGRVMESPSPVTLDELHQVGIDVQRQYKSAGESYESLMTVPRRDLGDSLKKAFSHVDDLLSDMGLETVEENRRAVRILGYNRMEINEENISRIREADRQVHSVMDKMTPAVTLKMIREGINPLESSLEELEQYLEEVKTDYNDETESYSRFLYHLEKNKAITPEERESYIGIYRLLRQIEKSDGAVIGSLINAQSKLQFSNLLSALRSRNKTLDIKIYEGFGRVSELVRDGESISGQIGRAFIDPIRAALKDTISSEELSAEYSQEQMELYRDAVQTAGEDCIALLQKGELTQNAGNILAMKTLLESTDNPFATGQKQKRGGNLWKLLDDATKFETAYEEEVDEASTELEMLSFSDELTSLDVRNMRLSHKQLSIATALSKEKEFFFPFYIGDKLTKIHLTIQGGDGESGRVEICMRNAEGEDLTAVFGFVGGWLQGKIIAGNGQEVMKMNRVADNFIKEAGKHWEIGTVSVMGADRRRELTGVGMDANMENQEFYHVAKIFLAAVEKEEVSYENKL